MLLDGIIALLKADSAVSALAGDRVYESELPRGYTLPAIAAHQYGENQDYDFGGPLALGEDQVQLDIYGNDAVTCRQLAGAVKAALNSYVGTLPDGTIVSACYLERGFAMPFLPNANTKGIANRYVLGYRVVNRPSGA